MLKFYGIRFNQRGEPERFTISFDLIGSLNAALRICDYFQGDHRKSIEAINREIDKLYRDPVNKKSKRFRLTVAKWFRSRDIIEFICGVSSTYSLKLKVANLLNSSGEIVQKWDAIETLLLTYLSTLPTEERDGELGNPESGLNLILQMVSLFFLEQDDESPPANLELQFIRSQFPKIVWKKRDGFAASSNPFWLPNNLFCRSSYLLTRVISRVYGGVAESDTVDGQLVLRGGGKSVQLKGVFADGSPFFARFPTSPPDEVRLEVDEKEGANRQLVLIPESASETLLSLQKIAQKRYSHEGVRHLLGIFRQLSEAGAAGMVDFDVRRHLALVSRITKRGLVSQKQLSLFERVFSLLKRVKVIRFWSAGSVPKRVTSRFITEISSEEDPADSSKAMKRLLLDPIFFPAAENAYRLGSHLLLVPPELFRESIQKHALLPGLSSFVTGTWLNEFPINRGVATKTTREVINGSVFNLTDSSKYKIVEKIGSELSYMNQKSFITDYRVTKDENGNPWNDLHSFAAPDEVKNAIDDRIRDERLAHTTETLLA